MKLPPTTPIRKDDPSDATSAYVKFHSDFKIVIIIDMNVYSIPSQNSISPMIEIVLYWNTPVFIFDSNILSNESILYFNNFIL